MQSLNNGISNVNSKVDSEIRKAIVSSLQEVLTEYGYGRQYATILSEALVGSSLDFYSTGNFFADTKIDINSKLGNAISNTDYVKLYGNAMTFNTYYKDVIGTVDALVNLNNLYDGEGELSPAARNELKKLKTHFINGVSSYVGGTPMIGVGYNTTFDFLNQKFDKTFDIFANKADGKTLVDTLGGLTNLGNWEPMGFISIYQGLMSNDSLESCWKESMDSLTWQDINKFYNDHPNEASCLDNYVEWRLQQEYRQRIEAYCSEKGITYEQYLKDLEKQQNDFEDALYSMWAEENPDESKKWGSRWYFDLFVKGNYIPGGNYDDVSSAAGVYAKEDIIDYFEETNAIDELSDRLNKFFRSVKSAVTNARNTRYDPLILDLDGDGYNVETKENGTNFDLDKNGFAEKINWTKKDGFLCLDLNGNGTIDNGGELFGDKTLLADGTTAKNGFEALAQYDGNGDGIIDEKDEIFGSLRIWVDADGNGISGEGEMKTLAELGITSINLGYENVNSETGTEATIGNTASFTRVDGTTGGIGELWVSSDLFDTVDKLDIEIPDDIKELPNIGSIGNVYSLHNAMALDETGELKALVESFASEQDLDKRMQIAEQILYFVCGANDVADGSRGSYMDAKQLAVIEAMLGEKYVGTSGANPHRDAAPMLKEAYADLLNMYFNELNAQTHIKDYAALLRYTENEDGTKTLNADLVNYVLEYQLSHGDEQAKNILGEIARYVQYLDNGGITGINDFVMNYAKISAEYAAEIFKVMPNGFAADGIDPLSGTNSADFLAGSDNGETINGGNGDDVIVGGKGNDTLYGGYGNDTYIFNLGDGNDVINEQNSNSASDKLVFGEGISITDIMFSNTGNNMEITFAETADSVTIINQKIDSYYRVENFVTSDGYTIDYSKVNQLIQAMASFEADTGMSWTEAVEQSNETANSIISEMWVKSVS